MGPRGRHGRPFSAGRRGANLREPNALDRAPYAIREPELSHCTSDARRLPSLLQQQPGQAAGPLQARHLTDRQSIAMGDAARVLAAYSGNQTVDFSLLYTFGGTVSLRATGHDHDQLKGVAEYLNLAFCLPTHFAYRRQAAAYHLGMKSLKARTTTVPASPPMGNARPLSPHAPVALARAA